MKTVDLYVLEKEQYDRVVSVSVTKLRDKITVIHQGYNLEEIGKLLEQSKNTGRAIVVSNKYSVDELYSRWSGKANEKGVWLNTFTSSNLPFTNTGTLSIEGTSLEVIEQIEARWQERQEGSRE